jgi:Mg-chelatase subunit ChlD
MLVLSKDETTFVNSIIIKKNSPYNERFGKEYTFGGTQMDVFVLQGEFTDPHDCSLLYKYCVSGFSKGSKTEFTLYYIYNQDGVVDVNVETKDGSRLNIEKSLVDETIDQIIKRLIQEREEQKRRASSAEIMFMVDTSYSMEGDPIRLAREAIRDFIRTVDLSRFKISILNFADNGRFECSNEDNSRRIDSAISSLAVDTCGIANAETPLNSFGNGFSRKDINRIIVVLTDGAWSDQQTEEKAADRLKADGITIYAIGFGGADEKFLNKIASESGARKIDLSKLSQTFVEIAGSIATER